VIPADAELLLRQGITFCGRLKGEAESADTRRMKLLIVAVVAVVVGLLGYNQLKAQGSEHHRAVETIQRLTEGNGSNQADQIECSAFAHERVVEFGDVSMWSCTYVESGTGRFIKACVYLSGKIPGVDGTGTALADPCRRGRNLLGVPAA
jgi:hypothetical protein